MKLSRSLPVEEGVPLNFLADYIAANAVAFNPENLHGHNINSAFFFREAISARTSPSPSTCSAQEFNGNHNDRNHIRLDKHLGLNNLIKAKTGEGGRDEGGHSHKVSLSKKVRFLQI
jgi:hypothetical protein